MNATNRAIIKTMWHADGSNWTPLAVSELTGFDRGYVKDVMNTMEQHGVLDRVSRGLYRVPR